MIVRVLPASDPRYDTLVSVPVRIRSNHSSTRSSTVSGHTFRAGPVIRSPKPTITAAWQTVSTPMRAAVPAVPRGRTGERPGRTASGSSVFAPALPGTAVDIGLPRVGASRRSSAGWRSHPIDRRLPPKPRHGHPCTQESMSPRRGRARKTPMECDSGAWTHAAAVRPERSNRLRTTSADAYVPRNSLPAEQKCRKR